MKVQNINQTQEIEKMKIANTLTNEHKKTSFNCILFKSRAGKEIIFWEHLENMSENLRARSCLFPGRPIRF